MVNFQKSKYLDIIKIIGENLNPINYSELKEKIGLADSTLSRDLNWLQNIDVENGLKSNKVDAFYLRKNAYIESTGIKKSKNNTYKLTKDGNDLFISLFMENEEISLVDLVIQDYKIYEKLWDYVDNNRGIFYNQIDNKLQPWTLQLFEFFEELREIDLNKVLNSLSGALNLRLYNFFKIITAIIFTHPLWETHAKENFLDLPAFNEMHFNILNEIPQIKQKFKLFGLYPKIFCIFKEDKFIKEINLIIERYLKIYYWKGIKYPIHEEIIRKETVKNVINELYEVCPEYLDFINQFHIEISLYIKNIIADLCSDEIQKKKLPLNILSPQIKDKIEYYLRRRIFLSEIDSFPSQLLKLGASKEIIYEQVELLKIKSDLEPENYKLKLKLLELLVYNYSNEFRSDYDFYNKFQIDLIGFIENLIEELAQLDIKDQESVLILGYIFYNQKYPIGEKAIKISEKLLNYYPKDETLLENLLNLYFREKEWNIKKIEKIIIRTLKLHPNNPFFQISKLIIKVIQDKNFILNKDFDKNLNNILEFEIDAIRDSINFFTIQLNRHELKLIALEILKKFVDYIEDPHLNWIYAEELLINQYPIEAVKVFLNLIDNYPNRFLESRILKIFLNNYQKFQETVDVDKTTNFIKQILDLLKLLSVTFEWHITKSEIKEFQEKREEHLPKLRDGLKKINSLLKNQHCLIIPLKIKAIILKALDREKNLESCLFKILNISPNNIWANIEMALLYFKQKRFDESFKLLELVDHLKERESYSIPYFTLINFAYLLEINDYNIFRLYKEAGRYNEASLLMEDFLLNPYSQQNINITVTKVVKDLIQCYRELTNNIDEVVERTLKLANKIDKVKGEEDSNIINIQKDSSYIRQSLIDYLFNERQHSRCLELILDLSKVDSNILEPRNNFFSPFNKNTFYLAECFLKLNNLILAKKYFKQTLEDLSDDIRFKARTNLLLIRPLPGYIKINEKQYYLKKINKGIKKIDLLLQKDSLIEKLIYKTNIERSIGNISLLIREREKKEKNFFENIRNHLKLISENDKPYYEIVVACSCALNGYIDEMHHYIGGEKVEKSYPIISTLLKILYCYDENNFEKFNELNIKLHRLIPNSLIPQLLNLHFLRFKKGIYEISKINYLFKTIWRINHKRSNIYGIEKQILSYFRNNLTWYPFKWTINYEKYIKMHKNAEIEQLFEVLHFIENKEFNPERELLDFITRSLNTNRRLPEFLSLLLILKGYKFPETKYFIYTLLNPEIQQYELKTFGEIAYQANKLNDFLPILDDYRNKELKKLKALSKFDWNIKWLEERYLTFLLNCFKINDLEKRIENSIKYLEKLEDYPKEKLRYFKILHDIRDKRYKDAQIDAYQLLKWFKDDSELKWDNEYFKIWLLSKFLANLITGKKLTPYDFFNDINELINFEKMKKNPIYFKLMILDVLNHELLEEYNREILKFAEKLFIEIISSINWSDNKSHGIIVEKFYFNREIFSKFSLEIVKELDKLIEELNPDKFHQTRKNYLYYIKAMIYSNNNKLKEAKTVLEKFFKRVNEEEIYTNYDDINELYLEILKNNSKEFE